MAKKKEEAPSPTPEHSKVFAKIQKEFTDLTTEMNSLENRHTKAAAKRARKHAMEVKKLVHNLRQVL